MESNNLNQLLVQQDANDKTTPYNNLDTEKLELLKQNFPEFDEFMREYKLKSHNYISFPLEEYNEYKPLDLKNAFKVKSFNNSSERNGEVIKGIRKCGLLIFIILSFMTLALGNGVLSIILILVFYVIAQINQYYNETMQTILKNDKIKEQKIKDLFTGRVKTMHEIVVSSKDDLDFKIKNSIDITGYVDLTRPPPFIFQENKRGRRLSERFIKIKNNNNEINNYVSIHFGFEELYVIDQESNKFMEDYLKNATKQFFITNYKFYTTFEFLRKYDIKIYLSIIFLVLDFYLSCKRDKYSIIHRKIISFNKDLNTEEILEKTKPFRPKLVNINNEVIEFTQEDIYHKADEKEYKEFIQKYREYYGKEIELYKSLGIKEGNNIYNEDFDYINVQAQIGEKFYVTIIVTFDAKIKEHTFVWEGNASGRCVFPLGKVDLNCNKDNYVERKDDGMNIIHIKYVPYPFEVKLLDNYKSFLKYADTQTVFGPARHY